MKIGSSVIINGIDGARFFGTVNEIVSDSHITVKCAAFRMELDFLKNSDKWHHGNLWLDELDSKPYDRGGIKNASRL